MPEATLTIPQTITLNVKTIGLTDEQFYQLCAANPDLDLELTAQGELVITSPSGSKTAWRGGKFFQRLANWTEANGTGVCFDASAGFTLPNGAKRGPDSAWLARGRWERLTPEQQEAFAPVCPDFVMELRSPTASLRELRSKMSEYIENGARLGWLIDPPSKRVYVYRSKTEDTPETCLENPTRLAGDPVLPGFVFDVSEIW